MYTYKLDYNDYHANLHDGLHSLLASSEMSDVTLAAEGHYFKAHQVILSMFSTYFSELFHVTPSRNTIFFVKNVKQRILKNLLVFMYEGKVEIPSEDFQLFVDTANELKIKGLTDDPNLLTTDLPNKEADVEICPSPIDSSHSLQNNSNEKKASSKHGRANSKPKQLSVEENQYNDDYVLELQVKGEESLNVDIVANDTNFEGSNETIGNVFNETQHHHIMKDTSSRSHGQTKHLEIQKNNSDANLSVANVNDTFQVDFGPDSSLQNLNNDTPMLPFNQKLWKLPVEGHIGTVLLCFAGPDNLRGVIWDDFRYYYKVEHGLYTSWKCTSHANHRCNARILLSKDGYICLANNHNHGKRLIKLYSSVNVESHQAFVISYENFKKFFPRRNRFSMKK